MADIAAEEKQDQLAFDKGFALETPPPEKTAAVDVKPKTETRPESKAHPKPTPKIAAKAEPKVPEPKFVQITQEQFDRLESAAGKTVDLERQLSKAFGTMGDMQQVVRRLQSATPAGMSVELPHDVVSEMEKDFPELAGHFRSALEKALKGLRGTAPITESHATADPETMRKEVQAISLKYEIEALEDAHPNWREIVGAVDSSGRHDPNNEFRKWLAGQDAAYQHKINATNSSTVISRAIDKFLASKKVPARTPAKPAPKVVARKNRIHAAIQPKGDGGQPTPAKTADDDFRAGFASG